MPQIYPNSLGHDKINLDIWKQIEKKCVSYRKRVVYYEPLCFRAKIEREKRT